MARRRASVFDDLVDVGSKLPWWAGVVLAPVTFLVFRHLAMMEVEPAQSLEGMGAMLRSSLIRTFSLFLQYLVPFALLLGAALSALARRRSDQLLKSATGPSGLRAVADMDWREFERLLGEVFRQRGFEVQETPAGPDGGVDLRLVKDGELCLVQCKHWRAQKVGVAVVRELYGVMAAEGAAGGYVVTTGGFTDEAARFAAGRNIELVAGQALARWLDAVGAHRRHAEPRGAAATSLCPRCGAAMVRRVAKRGAHAGRAFFGCSRFPSCRGTREA